MRFKSLLIFFTIALTGGICFGQTGQPTIKEDLFKMYISMIKNITCNDIIVSKQESKNKSRKYTYKLNDDLIKHHVELDKYVNRYFSNYDLDMLKQLNIEKPIHELEKQLLQEINDPFLDV